MEQGKCRSCGAQIIWIRSAKTDNLLPLDAEPVPDGNTYILDGKAVIQKGDIFDEMIDGPRYKSHFATCPNAQQHRKAKK